MPAEELNEEKVYTIEDFSGAIQDKTTNFFGRKNQQRDGLNLDYQASIGGISKRLGNSQKGVDLTTTTSTSTSTSTTTTSTSTSTSSSTSTSTTTTA